MKIKIEAMDTLFFRDGKPFTMNEDNWASGIFPPYPGVIYGALRTAYFANNINLLPLANKEQDPTKNLKVRGFYIRTGTDKNYREAYFPVPGDCVRRKNSRKDKNKFFALKLKETTNICSSSPLNHILTSDEEVEPSENHIFNTTNLCKYLTGGSNEFYAKRLTDYLMNEPKVGIARNLSTRTADDGNLYTIAMIRPKDMEMVIDFTGLEIPDQGFMKLGGEGKIVSYSRVDEGHFVLASPKIQNNRFKVYLATPAIFENGWVPKWINENTLIGNYEGMKLKLITASIGKPLSIGGFDVKARKPKPMYRAVLAGSVYYFEILDGDKKQVLSTFHNQCISDYYPEQGYGWSLVGGVK